VRLLDLKIGDILDYSGLQSRWKAPAGARTIWHIVVTELGSDKTVAKRLEDLDLKPYVPLVYKTICSGRGRRREVSRSMFPCYILLPMPPDGEAWHHVKTTRGVHDFLTVDGLKPATLSEAAIEAIRFKERQMDNKRQQRLALEGKSEWRKGEKVWVDLLPAPFNKMLAVIEDLDARGRINVLLEMELFGRKSWPVEPKQIARAVL
jgi:transcription antitermination factor NusG